MKLKSIFRFLQYFISILLAVVLLWYALRNVSFQHIQKSFIEADYRWILVSLVLAIVSHWSRAVRWKILLKPLGYQISTFHSFLAVMVGYFMNFIIPRAGEVVRCGTIQKLDKVSADTAFGTIVLERLIDVLMLFSMLVLLILVEFKQISSYFFEFFESKLSILHTLFYLSLIGMVFLLVFIFLFYRYRQSLQKTSLFIKIKKVLENVLNGILSIRQIDNKIGFIFHTFLIWLMYYLMAYVLFFCFPRTTHLDLWFGFIVLVMGAIGMATPVQGGFGAYHLLVGQIFALRGLTVADGIILATFMHTVQTIIIILVGGIAFLWSLFLINRIGK